MKAFYDFDKLVKKCHSWRSSLLFCTEIYFYPEGSISLINARCFLSMFVLLLSIIAGWFSFNTYTGYLLGFVPWISYDIYLGELYKRNCSCYDKTFIIIPCYGKKYSYFLMKKIIASLKQKKLFTTDFLDKVIEESDIYLKLGNNNKRESIFWISLSVALIVILINLFISIIHSHPAMLIHLLQIILVSIFVALFLSKISTFEFSFYKRARLINFFATVIKRIYLSELD